MTNAMISVVLFAGCGPLIVGASPLIVGASPLIVGASPLIPPRAAWLLSRELLVQGNLIEFIGFLTSLKNQVYTIPASQSIHPSILKPCHLSPISTHNIFLRFFQSRLMTVPNVVLMWPEAILLGAYCRCSSILSIVVFCPKSPSQHTPSSHPPLLQHINHQLSRYLSICGVPPILSLSKTNTSLQQRTFPESRKTIIYKRTKIQQIDNSKSSSKSSI